MLGLNLYGLYQRYNFDGSQSESVAQLASNVQYNSGQETSLEPGTVLNIKVPLTASNVIHVNKEIKLVVWKL